MTEVNPEPQEVQEAVVTEDVVVEADTSEVVEASDNQSATEDSMVPVSALQKERKKRQMLQQKVEFYENQESKKTAEEDYSKYESVTKEDLGNSESRLKREIQEENWSRQFPERARNITENLEEFLTKKPNLALAIEHAPNRLEEAWELMSRFAPAKNNGLKSTQKREAPQSPSVVPKSAALNETVNVMNMSDSEFKEYRTSKRRRR